MLLKMLKVTFTEFVFSLLFSSKTESWSNQLKSVFLLKNIHISLNFKIKFKHTFCSVLFIIIKWHHLSKYHNFILFKLYIYSLEVLCNRIISWLSWTSVKMRKKLQIGILFVISGIRYVFSLWRWCYFQQKREYWSYPWGLQIFDV